MRAIVIFEEGQGRHPLAWLLKPGYRHCLVAVQTDDAWVLLDGNDNLPTVDVLCGADWDLASDCRARLAAAKALKKAPPYTEIVEAVQRPTGRFSPLVLNNCVGLVKSILGIKAPWVLTPYQLYKYLKKEEKDATTPRFFVCAGPASSTSAARAGNQTP